MSCQSMFLGCQHSREKKSHACSRLFLFTSVTMLPINQEMDVSAPDRLSAEVDFWLLKVSRRRNSPPRLGGPLWRNTSSIAFNIIGNERRSG